MESKDKGFTLVELAVVMAIMGVIGLAVVGFIGISANQYKSVNKEVDVQQEAQIMMNQIGDLIVDAQKGIKYEVTGAQKNLIIYEEDCVYNVIFRAADSNIYLRKDVVDMSTGGLTIGKESLMAEYVKDFEPVLDEAESKNSVKITVAFDKGGKKYSSTQNFTIRNKVPMGDDVEFNPVVVEKLSVSIYHNGSDVTGGYVNYDMSSGINEIYFTSKVFGGDAPDQEVIWSVTGSTSDTEIVSSGPQTARLIIAENENSRTLKVTAISKADTSRSASVTVNLKNMVNLFDETEVFVANGTSTSIWISNNPTSYDYSEFVWHIKVEQVDEDGNRVVRNDLLSYMQEPPAGALGGDVITYYYTPIGDETSGNKQMNVAMGRDLGDIKLEVSVWVQVEGSADFRSNTVVFKNYN